MGFEGAMMRRLEEDLKAGPLLDFLAKESSQPVTSQDMWHQLEGKYGERIYSDILFLLTQRRFDSNQARVHWQNILSHREELDKGLGRDVGLRVALADYFVNVQPKVKNPIFIEIDLFLKKEESALRDELTGLYNRRFFNRVLQQELERSRRYGEPVSLLMVDIDHFKKFNDSYGHLAGDQALCQLAQVLQKTCRTLDHLTRFGGEEFALILPQADREQALSAAERHRLAVESHPLQGGDHRRLTISVGAATYPEDASTGLELLEMADQALYQAKRSGKNNVRACAPNKRSQTRFPLNMALTYRRLGIDDDFIEGQAGNISTGGVLWKTGQAAQKDWLLELRMENPTTGAALTLKGQCVWVARDQDARDSYLLGVRFLFNSPEEEKAVNDFINEKSQASG